jgi:hypothetical protein
VLIPPTIISFIIGATITGTSTEISYFPEFLTYFLYISLFSGIGILLEIISPKRNQNRIIMRLIAASILILVPLLYNYPQLQPTIIFIDFCCGILIGIHGVMAYLEEDPHCYFYIYLSAVFIIIIPLLEFWIYSTYKKYLNDILEYRSSFIGCHLPVIGFYTAFAIPSGFFSMLFYWFQKFLFERRKTQLIRKLQQQNIIPSYFKEISEK